MNERLPFVVLAALVHDVGKLLERGDLFSEARTDETYLSTCPCDPHSGRPTHLHGAYTRCFCDWLEERFLCLRRYPDRSWKDWAAAHHKDEPDLHFRVIRLADRYSAQEREPGQFYTPRVHQRTMLEPVLERVCLEDGPPVPVTRYRHPLRPLGAGRESLFPVPGEELGLLPMEGASGAVPDPSGWSHLLRPKDRLLNREYTELGEGLLDEIDAVARKAPGLGLEQLLVTLMTLLERYTANVPSASNVRHPDISLYDHLRSTAAIAQALFLHHSVQPVAAQGLEDSAEEKWLLVCGDFSGIQKFIYRLTNKGAAKGLRGRSFYVQAFCRICAHYLLKKLEVTRAALLYNSGGKFYLLLPSHMREKLLESRRTINRWLAERYDGEVYLGIGTTPINGEMFREGHMHQAWSEVHMDLERDRLAPFKDVLLEESRFFEPQRNFDPTRSCRVCGSRSLLSARDDGQDLCTECESLQDLGRDLGRARALLVVWGREELERIGSCLNLRPYPFDALEAGLFLLDDPEGGGKRSRLLELEGKPVSGEWILLNLDSNDRLADHPIPECSLETFYLGKWEERREPWDFQDYADHSRGIKRLGILRMDVDNLGLVFVEGLRSPVRSESGSGKSAGRQGWGEMARKGGRVEQKPMASLSRMVTLSRQLNAFFSGYVPRLLDRAEFSHCQVVYAGGDDLFIIGSWDRLPPLAETIREDFRSFCCGNPVFTISGGISLIRPKYPMYRGARLAGDAEKKAKSLRGDWKDWGILKNDLHKDAFTFLDVPVTWHDLRLARYIRDLIQEEVDSGRGRGLLAWLRELAASNILQTGSLRRARGLTLPEAWKKIMYDRWRWLTAYQLRRRFSDRAGEKHKRETWTQVLFSSTVGKEKADLPVYTWLELPVRWVEYLNREGGNNGL